MIYKSSLTTPIILACIALSIWLISSSLMAQDSTFPNSPPKPPDSATKDASNLITNNPFVPLSSESYGKAKNTPNTESLNNKTKVLQKYLQFKSIAIIDKKKYYSIFNKRTNRAFWISDGETIENFRVVDYDQVNSTISITDGINTEIIPITDPNDNPINVVTTPKTEEVVGQKVATPKVSETTTNQDKEKPKVLPRRRVIPAKR